VLPLGQLLVHPIYSVVSTQVIVFNPYTLFTEPQGWVLIKVYYKESYLI